MTPGHAATPALAGPAGQRTAGPLPARGHTGQPVLLGVGRVCARLHHTREHASTCVRGGSSRLTPTVTHAQRRVRPRPPRAPAAHRCLSDPHSSRGAAFGSERRRRKPVRAGDHLGREWPRTPGGLSAHRRRPQPLAHFILKVLWQRFIDENTRSSWPGASRLPPQGRVRSWPVAPGRPSHLPVTHTC